MEQEIKTRTGYAIIWKGVIQVSSIGLEEEGAIKKLLDFEIEENLNEEATWESLQRKGFSCIQVSISPIKQVEQTS